MAKNGVKLWVGRICLLVVSVVLTALLCEFVARRMLPQPELVRVEVREHPEESYGRVTERRDVEFGVLVAQGAAGRRMKPNVRAVHRPQDRSGEEIVIETNRYGLRYGELGDQEPGEVRVLVLGDSVTTGAEVHAHELFTSRAEEMASGRSGPVRVMNGGVISASLSQTFFQLAELVGPVDPDVVVIQLYLNDARQASIFAVDMVPAGLRRSRFLMWAADRVDRWRQDAWVRIEGIDRNFDEWERSFVVHQRKVYAGDFESFERLHPTTRDRAAGDYGLGWNADAWAEIEKMIVAALDVCVAHDVDLALMLAPVDLQVYGSQIDRVPQEHFAAMCERLELPCLDLLPPLRDLRQSTGVPVLYDQCHLTPVAHEAVGEEMVRWLDEEQLLPP